MVSNQAEKTPIKVPRFVGRKEQRLAKHFKERIEDEIEKIQILTPIAQSNELLKVAKELLTDTNIPSGILSFEKSRSPYQQYFTDAGAWDVWEKLTEHNEGTFGWLLTKEDPHARPI